MAKIVITISDETQADGVTGIRYAFNLDREGEGPDLARFPATPAMLTALTVKRLIDSGTINTLIGTICTDIITKSAEERGFAKAVAEEAQKLVAAEQQAQA
jgi:hypothetical protein